MKRARNQCEYCYAPFDYCPDPFTVEHLIPRSLGGATTLDNLALACFGCNNLKYTHSEGFDPETGQSVPLYHPRHDRWSDHFAWIGMRIEPLTPTGRVTVARLKLNRPSLLNLRDLLFLIGKHPPLSIDD